MIDPGLMTDSTGEGMAGATDVSLSTQLSLKKKHGGLYNGSGICKDCGLELNPYEAMTRDRCYNCKNRRDKNLVNRGMVG